MSENLCLLCGEPTNDPCAEACDACASELAREYPPCSYCPNCGAEHASGSGGCGCYE